MTINIRVARINRDVAVNWDDIPNASRDFVINYGLKQLFNDSIVSGKTDGERNGLLGKKLSKLMDGTLSVREGGTRESDPIAKELTRLATLKTAAKFKGVKKPDLKAWADSMAAYRAMPAMLAQAEKNVAELAMIPDL